jgi:DNA-binding beta-propeller fold protein YncE
MNGYSNQSQTVTVVKDQTTSVQITLVPVQQTGYISVSSTPTGAKIYWDDADTGYVTPIVAFTAPVGTHTVKLSMNGYLNQSQTVTVVKDQTTSVQITLVPVQQTGYISVSSTPTGAKIYWDDADTGYVTPIVAFTAPVGTHTVKLSMNGYSNQSQTVTVVKDQTTSVQITLVPVQQTGYVSVSSTPTGAKIYWDDADTGYITPMTIPGITTGSHIVKCTLNGYSNQSQTISVSADQTTNVQMTLVPVQQTGYVSVSSTPTGAKIYLDNADTGYITPMTIPGITTGSHIVKCTLNGYNDQSQTISVSADQTTNVNLVLEILQSSGSIFVQSNPKGARIYLDYNDTGFVTPKTIPNLAIGSHLIRCTLDGYNDNSITVSVTQGQNSNVNLSLVNSSSSITLSPGWNFVSTPKALAQGYNTGSIFTNVDMGTRSAWMWDGSQSPPRWNTVQTDTPIQPLYGIWIYSVSPTVVNLKFDPTNMNTPPTRSLPAGWNTIGFTGLTPSSARNTYLSVQPSWTTSMRFDPLTQSYQPTIFNGDTSESTILYPTVGYWLYMRDPGNLAAIGV